MSRTIFLFFLFFTLVSFKTLAQKEKLNVLLILVDDLKPSLGIYGDTVVKSPNLDRLGEMGVRFENAYCNQAVCMASRYNLLLGSRSTSTGFYNFGLEFRAVYPNATTLPQHFKNNGYQVESMGKVFHIGHGNDNDEASWSIPHHKDKVIEYLLPESTNRKLTREEAFFTNARKYNKNLPPNKELERGAAWEAPDVLDEAYADGRVASHAIERLRKLSKDSSKPFFMAVGFVRPHLPFSAPKKYWDYYDPEKLPLPEFEEDPEGTPKWAVKKGGEICQFKPVPENNSPFSEELKRNLIHGYYASISYMDAQVGRVIEELKRLNLDKNTIIVLWGDHGWHLGDHGSWTKHSNFEQATRIPVFIYAPGVTQPKSISGQLFETVDIYPTLSALAGFDLPDCPQPIDGMNMLPVLKNPQLRIRNHAYHAYPKNRNQLVGCAIRTDRYRMVEWTDVYNPKTEKVYELYDYQEDPLETKNYAKEKPDIIAELKTILGTHPPAKAPIKK
ncbi:sulfatase [Flexithrix dorotheae]|uniref:sulfatase n=1 Tax=Flexithrix dorotheae TaxID=70993 RepID=UPI0003762BB1|nr:sulfatase [Flexithrix dorotheae]